MSLPQALGLNTTLSLNFLNSNTLLSLLKDNFLFDDQLSHYDKYFSKSCVFIDPVQLEMMKNIILLTQKFLYHPKHLSKKKLNSNLTPGIFCGYDFHLTALGPKLIEINSNAGGALLNFYLLKAQELPKSSLSHPDYSFPFPIDSILNFICNQFLEEWEIFHKNKKIQRICIVDDNPTQQFLYPEFELFKNLLTKNIAPTTIEDPSNLKIEENYLLVKVNGSFEKVDFVYNRLTDFYFSEAHHSHLKTAYEKSLCFFSPSPIHHEHYANKTLFTEFQDTTILEEYNFHQSEIHDMLAAIPYTELVSKDNATELWKNRKKLFFKPTMGHGSKAVYRGDKISHRTFEEIMLGQYIAQEYIAPPVKLVQFGDQKVNLKFDIRIYTYNGNAYLAAARLYEGQATNFRTQAGGFAPVILV